MIDDPAPNALAVGRNPHDSVICVTRGLVNGIDREELQGVIAHEMAHIRSYDAWLATLVTATRLGRIGSFPASLYQKLTRGTEFCFRVRASTWRTERRLNLCAIRRR